MTRKYGRDDEEWDQLTEAGLEFLIECAERGALTTYTDLNNALITRTGLRGFDFSDPSERAAVGELLWLIVERERPRSGFMISALVRYTDANDAGPGFYGLAEELGLLKRGASANERTEFWIKQTSGVQHYYRSGYGSRVSPARMNTE